MTAHIRHMIDKGGEDLPCLGTDFDGFDGMDKMDLPDQKLSGAAVGCLEKGQDLQSAK